MPFPLDIPIRMDRDSAAREAAQELAKNKYHQELPQPVRDLIATLQRWAREMTDLLFGRLPLGAQGTGSTALVVGVILAVVLGIVAVLIWRFGLPRRGARVPDAAVETDAAVAPEDYRNRAEAAAAAGDWATAVQESFRAMVRELELRTVIEPRPARTAYETAALIARQWPSLEPQLFTAAMTFNEVLYGHRPASGDDYAVMANTEQAVVRAADDGWTGAAG